MSEIDPRLRPLVEAARAAGPTAEDRARIRTALAARLALPASGSAPPQAAAGAHPAVAGVGAKVVAAGVLIGATGFGAVRSYFGGRPEVARPRSRRRE